MNIRPPDRIVVKRLDNGKLVPVDVKVGDRILLRKYSGSDIKPDGKEYLIIREGRSSRCVGPGVRPAAKAA